MGLGVQTAAITSTMALCFVAPRISKKVEAHSKTLLLIGTGGLVSLYFVDLLPDVVHLGGFRSLGIIIFVWLLYSYIHTFHIQHHVEHRHGSEEHNHSHAHFETEESSWLLMASMIAHCFSSGMLLFMSHELSTRIAATVFLALIGHKGYEAMSVSVLLNEQTKNTKKFAKYAAMYACSFPVGVIATGIMTHFLNPSVSPTVVKTMAILVASFAVGTLAGCMVNDFLLPSLKYLRTRKPEAAWLLVGIGLTVLFTVGA